VITSGVQVKMDAEYLKAKHSAGLAFDDFLATGTPPQGESWRKTHSETDLTAAQRDLVGSFVRRMNIIGLAGIWCGDCAQQCPLIQRIADANPEKIDLKWLERDAHMDLQEQVAINAGNRVPVLIFCAEDHELVGWYGDRTLTKYRAIAQKKLGTACALPGAAVDPQEQAAVLQDWLDQIERVQLLLRLSGRLRQKHGD